eukprot:TRINITY_DN20145_c0_g1_i1.p1 TRINITY_DN20145_c0_g1~~TRINITY_DN20145_c0_g1_i1.p1  ORF type:complete len:527 (+),score=153.53 TRINITY_DN20145_c0_g1_i1:53-1582(+)
MASPRWQAATEHAIWPLPASSPVASPRGIAAAASPRATTYLVADDVSEVHVPTLEDWENRTWWQKYGTLVLLLPCATSYTVLLAMISPRVIKVLKDQYGSDGDAAMVQAMYDSGGAFLAFLTAGLVGVLSDAVGRKPLLIASVVLNILPPLTLWVGLDPSAYLLSMQFGALASGGKGGSLVLAPPIADTFPPKYRTVAFAVMLGAMCAGLTVGPVSSSLSWSDKTTYMVATCTLGAIALYAILVVPETLPREARTSFSRDNLRNPFKPLKHLRDSRLVMALGLLSFLTTLPEFGMIDLFLFYLDDQLNFSKRQQSWFLFEIGITLVIGQGPLMYFLFKWLKSPVNVLLFSITANVLYLGIFMVMNAAWQVYGIICVVISAALLCFPILTGLTSQNFPATQQGAGLGTITAVKGLAMATGPVVFTQLYGQCKKPPLNFPQMPFAFGILLMLGAAAVVRCMLLPALAEIRASRVGSDDDDKTASAPASPALLCDGIPAGDEVLPSPKAAIQ